MKLSLLLGIAVALSSANTAQASSYTFTTIDAPGAADTYLSGLNDVGQIIGYASGSNLGAFVWRDGVYTKVPGNAYGINNSGDIVGVLGDNGYLFSGGALTFIPGVTNALGINDAGDIVGNVNYPAKGYLYKNGTFTYLDAAGFDQTGAADINNTGKIVGIIENFSDLYFHSYVYSGGTFTAVDYPGAAVPGNYWFTEVTGINDAGTMAGFMRDQSGPHSFVDVNGTFTLVDFPGSASTYVYGINNAGQLVGNYNLPDGASHGFLATPVPTPEPTTVFLICAPALLILKKGVALRR